MSELMVVKYTHVGKANLTIGKQPIFMPAPGDVGYDLVSQEDTWIPPQDTRKVATGLAIEMPEGMMGLILDRSSVATRKILVVGGVIDPAYRGEIKVILFNGSDRTQSINAGDRIAQLVFMPYYLPALQYEIALSATERGEKGFGSTNS